jgi:DNA-binding GntR family transcriptional regulator
MAGDGVLTQVIDPASDRAVYKQIADHLREAIARSRLREGEQLPSEAQLMEHYGVARMTIRNALRVLQDEGLTTAEHGRGVYVRARPPVRRLASDRFAQRHRKAPVVRLLIGSAVQLRSQLSSSAPVVGILSTLGYRVPIGFDQSALR